MGSRCGGVLLLARAVNAAFSAAHAWMAVRFLRGFRVGWLAFVVVLFPSVIVQAADVTADTYTNATVILFVAAAVRLCVDVEPPRRALVAAGIAGLAVVFAKPSYAVLLALVFAVPVARLLPPRWRTGSARQDAYRARGIRWGYLAIAAVVTALVLLVTSSAPSAISAMYRRGAVPAEQVTWVLSHPIDSVLVVVCSVIVWGDIWARSLFGSIGYNGINPSELAVIVLVAPAVIAALAAEPFDRWRGGWFAAVAAVGVLVSMLALYLTFTPVGSTVVYGVQGRYFAPLVLPLLIGLRSLVPMRAEMSARASAIVFPVGSALVLGALVTMWLLALH